MNLKCWRKDLFLILFLLWNKNKFVFVFLRSFQSSVHSDMFSRDGFLHFQGGSVFSKSGGRKGCISLLIITKSENSEKWGYFKAEFTTASLSSLTVTEFMCFSIMHANFEIVLKLFFVQDICVLLSSELFTPTRFMWFFKDLCKHLNITSLG